MYLRPKSYKNCSGKKKDPANNHGVTVCYTAGTDSILYAMVCTNLPVKNINGVLQAIRKELSGNNEAVSVLNSYIDKIDSKSNQDTFSRKEGRSQALKKYEDYVNNLSSLSLDTIKGYAKTLRTICLNTTHVKVFDFEGYGTFKTFNSCLHSTTTKGKYDKKAFYVSWLSTDIDTYLNSIMNAKTISNVPIEFVNACLYREASISAYHKFSLFRNGQFYLEPPMLNLHYNDIKALEGYAKKSLISKFIAHNLRNK
jgi:hypothetical protein